MWWICFLLFPIKCYIGSLCVEYVWPSWDPWGILRKIYVPCSPPQVRQIMTSSGFALECLRIVVASATLDSFYKNAVKVGSWRDETGCFRKWWYPQIIHFNRVFHYKPSILGYPYFGSWNDPGWELGSSRAVSKVPLKRRWDGRWLIWAITQLAVYTNNWSSGVPGMKAGQIRSRATKNTSFSGPPILVAVFSKGNPRKFHPNLGWWNMNICPEGMGYMGWEQQETEFGALET